MPKGVYTRKPFSEEHKRKIGEASSRVPRTPEWNEKISKALAGIIHPPKSSEEIERRKLAMKNNSTSIPKMVRAVRGVGTKHKFRILERQAVAKMKNILGEGEIFHPRTVDAIFVSPVGDLTLIEMKRQRKGSRDAMRDSQRKLWAMTKNMRMFVYDEKGDIIGEVPRA